MVADGTVETLTLHPISQDGAGRHLEVEHTTLLNLPPRACYHAEELLVVAEARRLFFFGM